MRNRQWIELTSADNGSKRDCKRTEREWNNLSARRNAVSQPLQWIQKTQYIIGADGNNIKCTEAHMLMSKNVRNKHILVWVNYNLEIIQTIDTVNYKLENIQTSIKPDNTG